MTGMSGSATALTTASAASRVQPPAKTASRRKSACSDVIEQIVAPGDRRAQRLLPLGAVAAAARERGQPAVKAGEDRVRGKQAHAGRGQLDGQRQSVEATANGDDGVDVLLGEREVAGRTACARSTKS